MNIVKTLKHKKNPDVTVLGIDASSTVIALSFLSQKDQEARLINTSKIALRNHSMNEKLNMISYSIPDLLNKYNPDYIFIEQPIYIQNPATSRVLSQISGHLIGECLKFTPDVSEVTVANWKSFIGYKNVSKAEKDFWTKEFGEKESKKIAAAERKQRTIKIVHQKISGIDHINDNDICDAIGISLYGLDKVNRGDFNGS